MFYYHERSKTKISGSGAKLRKSHDKKLRFKGNPPVATKVSEGDERETVRGRGGCIKVKLKKAQKVNVVTPQGIKKVQIRGVLETPDNRHHARQRIITKGAIIDTELGRVKITNRVGQNGVVNGILLQNN
ncbi:MAG: 30S ribosomal protein S8e [Candidatus Anstonellales archaeon]